MEEVERDREELGEEEQSGGRRNRTRLIILLSVVGMALGYMVYAAFPNNALFFMTVSEFMVKDEAQDGRIVRVAGKLVDGSFLREGNSTLTSFQLIDKEDSTSVEHLSATYNGVLPDLFFNPHSEIILQGSFSGGHIFEADRILVKCPSKYRSLEDELQSTG